MANDDFKYSRSLDEIMEADNQQQAAIAPPAAKKKKGLLDTLSDTFIGKKIQPRKEYGDL